MPRKIWVRVILNGLGAAMLCAVTGANAATTTRVTEVGGVEADGPSIGPVFLSGDGRFVAFASDATNLVPGSSGTTQVYVKDLATGVVERVSSGPAGEEGNQASFPSAVSSDGRFVVFTSTADDLVLDDTNESMDAFLRDRLLGTTERVSLAHDGSEATKTIYASFQTFGRGVSTDGRLVLFDSFAPNLVVGDTNEAFDAFLRDRVSHTTSRVSLTDGGGQISRGGTSSSMSRDARFVVFGSSGSGIVPGFGNGYSQVYLRDRVLGRTIPVSVGSTGAAADQNADFASVSGDGAFVAFRSSAPNLAAPGWQLGYRIYLRDVSAGSTVAISSYDGGKHGVPRLSGNGRFVVYPRVRSSDPDDVNEARLFDRTSGSTELVSVNDAGEPANADSIAYAVSDDGRRVAFSSKGSNLVTGDDNFTTDVFLRERSVDPPPPADACANGADDDGDGLGDFPNDPGCLDSLDPSERGWRHCDDGIDNDEDGRIDLADPGCEEPADWNELGACEDGEDNDGDGHADYPADPGCRRPTSISERTECQDGVDNDGQAGIDFDGGASVNLGVPLAAPDPQCDSAWKNRERASACGLGWEVALSLPVLMIRGRRGTAASAKRGGQA